MQKVLLGILGVLVLFLAAMNVRLSGRVHDLEDRLCRKESRTPAKAELEAAPVAPAMTVPSEIPNPPAPAPAASARAATPAPEVARVAVAELHAPQQWNTADLRVEELEGNQRTIHLALAGNAVSSFTVAPVEAEPQALAGPRPGFLGIMGEDVPGGGVKVSGIVPGSVAAASGLRPDDVILEYNGDRIDTLSTLTSRIRAASEGAPASLRIRRDGVELYQGVQLGARR